MKIALIVGSLPNTLTNGTTADATQVMADLNKIVNDVNANAAEAALVPTLAGANIFAAVQTGVAATQANHFPIASQVQNSSFVTVASVSGTNTITGSVTALPVTAYVTRQIFTWIPTQPNTGPATADFGGGALAIQASGSALTGGEIKTGVPAQVVHNGTNFQLLGSILPIGVMLPFAGSNAPAGFLLCFGQAVSRDIFNGLFAILGTAWGVGDGATTFNLPDLRGRSVFGRDDMGGAAASRLTGTTMTPNGTTVGAVGGAQTVTISTGELPASGLSVPGLSVPGLSVPGLSVPGLSVPSLSVPALAAGTLTFALGGAVGDAGSTTRAASADSAAGSSATPAVAGSTATGTTGTGTTGTGTTGTGTTGTGNTGTGTTGNMGTAGALNKMPPAAVANWIIKY